ncbi:Retrovirus-related Pol polyprotein from transposon 297 [Anthophora quadrimaculata]
MAENNSSARESVNVSAEENPMSGANANASFSIADIVPRVIGQMASQFVPNVIPMPSTSTSTLMAAIPEFAGHELGDDAATWCEVVEEISKDASQQQRLSIATHALSGPAKAWYQGWKGRPRTWAKFKEDLYSVFVTEKKLHEHLLQALTYTSDSAPTYSQYARRNLLYLEQTRIAFKPEEYIELIVGTITDQSVRQAMINGTYTTTAALIVGISRFVKVTSGKHNSIESKDSARKQLSSVKRCYSCDGLDHILRDCPKRKKMDGQESIKKRTGVSYNYCKKKGHEESRCWQKQRNVREGNMRKHVEANTFRQTGCKLTPVKLRDVEIHCLLDNGADCSLLKERVVRRIGCKIDPYKIPIKGLGDITIWTIGHVDVPIRVDAVDTHLDFCIVRDEDIPYEAIIGRNVVTVEDVRIGTGAEGTHLEKPVALPEGHKDAEHHCCTIVTGVEEAREPIRNLLSKYSCMIAEGSNVRSIITGEMNITTVGNKVINYHPYRLSFSERETVINIIDNLLQNGIIRESTSPFTSPIVLVKKKDGSTRMCVDYRALNKITVKDRYPLPLIEDQLNRLGKGKYFSTLDMSSGFYQIPVAADSAEKTAFVTPDGHYEFLKVPFGLANAPAVFQRAINEALGALKNNIALVYLDDVMIPSQTVEESLKSLDKVLHALSVAGFSLNLGKCKFLQTSVEYLGREISADGIRPGKCKVHALLDSPTPTNVQEVRQFMGLAGYFRKFIPEFATRMACITKLTKKDTPWSWGQEQTDARQYVIDKLCAKPLLIIFDPNRETEHHTDASSTGYGAILFQRIDSNLHVAAYFSRRATPEESRYHSYKLETLWDSRGPIHFELLKPNEKLNSERYCQQLDNLKIVLPEKRPAMFNRKDIILLYDNARPHAALGTRQKLAKLFWEILSHPPYSPDLAPSDFHLFLSLQNFLQGKKFKNEEDIRQALVQSFASSDKALFKNGIYKLPSRWQEVINNDGNYIIQ